MGEQIGELITQLIKPEGGIVLQKQAYTLPQHRGHGLSNVLESPGDPPKSENEGRHRGGHRGHQTAAPDGAAVRRELHRSNHARAWCAVTRFTAMLRFKRAPRVLCTSS